MAPEEVGAAVVRSTWWRSIMSKTATQRPVESLESTLGSQVIALLKLAKTAQASIQSASCGIGRVQHTLRRQKSA